MTPMAMLQIFETTMFSDSSSHAMHAVVVPKRSFVHHDYTVNPAKIIGVLQLSKITLQPVAASNLGPALAVLASPTVPANELIAHVTGMMQPVPPTTLLQQVLTPADREFGEQMAYARWLPFEQSPLDLESISTLVTSATGAGLGAYVGFVVAGPTPLLFVTVPAGMIICGAAKGLADALEKGLRDRLLRWLKGEDQGDDSDQNSGK
jgi:hypothetical protein